MKNKRSILKAMATIAIVASMSIVSCESEPVDMSELVQKEGIWFLVKNDKPFTGKFVGRNPFGGGLLAKGSMKNGKMHGIAERYEADGKLSEERNYKDGELHGVSKEYYESGKLKEEQNYEKGKVNGVVKAYHENGKLSAEVNFKDGNRHGIAKWYDEDGKLKEEKNYKDGVLQ